MNELKSNQVKSRFNYDFRVKGVRGKLIDVEDNKGLDFVHIPDEITESTSSQWKIQGDIIGRSAPLFGYASTGERLVSYQLTLFADIDAETQIKNTVAWLRSFMYPVYTSANVMFPPHRIRLVLGSFLSITGIMEGIDCTYRAPYEKGTLIPMYAEVPIQIKEVLEQPPSYAQIRKGPWM